MFRLLKQNIVVAAVFVALLVVGMVAVTGYGESIYNPFTFAAADPEVVEELEPEDPPEEEQVLSATAEGYGGPLTVEVTVRNGEIVSVEVVEHSETPGLSDPAIEQVTAAIVEAQSAEVDSVSGATVTAEAIMEAAAAALEDAGQ